MEAPIIISVISDCISRVEELDAIPHDNSGYVDVKLAQMKVRNDEKQPSTSEGCIYQTAWR
jgi:hypothetical protein